MTAQRLRKMFQDVDRDQDGFVTFQEFLTALEQTCNALSPDEANFLFHFWDTMAGQQEPQGAVQSELAITDLMSSMPEYSTAFRSGDLGFRQKQAKGNMPSEAGGIFGGGSYAADAQGLLDVQPRAPAAPHHAPVSQAGGTAAMPSMRPKGNQPSM